MGVLLMLMTIGGSISAAILFAAAVVTSKAWLKKFTIGGVIIWFAFYFAMLLGFSLMSREKDLSFDEPKEYCGFYLDCHMHTSVTAVRTTKTIGDKAAKGEFYIVKVKVSSNARREPLALHTVDAHVVDGDGQAYTRDIEAETQLPTQPEFEKRIAPSESFEKEIVFDLPADVNNPRLDISEGYWIDQAIEAVLVDDEDSILHKRNYFTLSEPGAVATGIPEQTDTASVK